MSPEGSLTRYERINRGEAIAKFQIARRVEVEGAEELDELLRIHSQTKSEFLKILRESAEFEIQKILSQKIPKNNFIKLKVKILREILKNCVFCERRCEVNRYEETGVCKCTDKSYYSSEFLHMGEEPELVPSNTIFFNRCTFKCVFCQNFDIVYHDDYAVNPHEIAGVIERRYRQGSRNVNFVGGNPDQHAHTIMEILNLVDSNIPVVWNSNMYHSEELAEIIEDVVDVWLGDFKYGNDRCALKYSKVKNYWKVVTRNFKRASQNGELLIRHLIMPGHLECCTEEIVKWVSEKLGKETRFNLMFQYYPTFKAMEYPEIARRLTRGEMSLAVQITEKYGLNNLV